ncbi:FAD/FMN-dependent dehydrogenase [Brevibacillus sp. CF112]|uniref:FAD-binding oxidoreductase n=1 Tax=Brevibacillus TaxID=55080 RepID=UPI000271BBE2|nr:FAD-dependent oxidoreductase [Brevibacillus sp. CF112]EJL42055.1 FAD/FMN-dependent dehydrogenase [Brevibacillus sp. CF112]
MPWTYGLTGRVIVEGESGYEEARLDFNTRISKFPKGIVYCMNEQDVANAVIWARKNKMPFRVRGGGHSYEAFSLVDGGLVIDVSELLHLKIDKVGGTARVGAGFRVLPLYEALWKQGLTVPRGVCSTTGVSGLILGGGYGYLDGSNNFVHPCYPSPVVVNVNQNVDHRAHQKIDHHGKNQSTRRVGNFFMITIFECSA